MTKKEIIPLLDRYFEAETSLEEEARLHQYFNAGEVDPDLEVYASYFLFLKKGQNIKAPAHLEKTVLKNIQNQVTPEVSRIKWLTIVSKIAAIFILCAGCWFLYRTNTQPTKVTAIDWSKYEVKSEEEALRITKMAFLKTSQSLKTGANIARTEIQTTKKRWSF